MMRYVDLRLPDEPTETEYDARVWFVIEPGDPGDWFVPGLPGGPKPQRVLVHGVRELNGRGLVDRLRPGRPEDEDVVRMLLEEYGYEVLLDGSLDRPTPAEEARFRSARRPIDRAADRRAAGA